MKNLFLTYFVIALSGCVTIYKNDLSIKNATSSNGNNAFQLSIDESEKLIRSDSTNEPEESKISNDAKEKIQSEIYSKINKECAEKKRLKYLQISFETIITPDNTCWLFTLCYIVVPGMQTGTQKLKVKINQTDMFYFADSISYRSYAHILLLPALIYKPFDQRDTKAKLKLLEMFSNKYCSSENKETFLNQIKAP